MTLRTLIRRSLRFHARAHLGVVLGAAIGSAALIGALLVGDSVRETLIERALARLGLIHFALYTPDRLFQTKSNPQALLLPGLAARPDGSARANRVNVIGVSPFWGQVWQAPRPAAVRPGLAGNLAWINEALARQLGVRPGDEIIVRVRKPTALALDAALSPREENAVAMRVKIKAILPAVLLGDFALTAQPTPPQNLFLSQGFLAAQLGVPQRANLLVYGPLFRESQPAAVENLRTKLANWLFTRAPTRGTGLGFGFGRGPDNHSLAVRLAHFIEPRTTLPSLPDALALPRLQARLESVWLPDDARITVRAIEPPPAAVGGEQVQPWIEMASSRIFLDPPVVAAALKPRTTLSTNRAGISAYSSNDLARAQFVTNAFGVVTYLANAISAGDRLTPYSMVTAASGPFTPAGMKDDEILVNDWLADDLQVKPGDTVALSYFVADSGSRLTERTNAFRVRAVVPMKGIYADRTLMPEFPGVAHAETTHDWDVGFPLVHKIRPQDEAYWKSYRGTPKAFITLAAGQALWANRFGSLTAVRYPVPLGGDPAAYRGIVSRNLAANLSPADLGFRWQPVRQQALQAASQSQDFGQLFLGFSFFLVLAALLLMALLFQFGLEQRAAEVGTFLALGFTARQVRRLFLAEGAVLALLGGLVGVLGGVGYAQAMLWGLATAWRDAVGATTLHFHASAASLVAGLCSSTVVATLTIWFTLRRQARQPIRELLEFTAHGPQSSVHSLESTAHRPRSTVRRLLAGVSRPLAVLVRPLPLALLCGAAAVGIVIWAMMTGQRANAGAFFGAGALLLAAGLAFLAAWLRVLASSKGAARLTVSSLAVRSCARRRGRSLATAALLACGCFVITAIGVFRLDANRDATRRDSGTGGFALLGESTLPVARDLNTRAGLEAFGLSPEDLPGVRFVPFRVRQGDEASCLNLNRAQQPRLLGVNPDLLAGRFTFTAAARGCDRGRGWGLVQSTVHGPPGFAKGTAGRQSTVQSPESASRGGEEGSTAPLEVPAIGDANAIEWALGKELGDTLDYRDDRGRVFRVKLVGALANSVLQGSLIINEAEFVRRFPNESGYRFFLIDAPTNSVRQVSASLSRALQDVGMELTPAAERLDAFNAVQNTYLGTFQVLGGLGLLLGSAGLGIVVLRNILERRGELGLLAAVGFRRRTLEALALSEHGALLGLGLGIGIAAAAVAVLPSLLTPGASVPYKSLALTLGAVLLNGALWTWVATLYSLRGNLLETLRNE